MNLKIGLLSIFLTLIGFILNLLREPLLGFIKGYAPHNLTFSVYVLFPILLLSLSLGGYAFVREIIYLNKLNYKGITWQSYLTLISSFPSFILGLIGLVIISVFMSS
jgi:hypothetical protein